MLLHEALDRLAWYVIRPPHTACDMGEHGERTRISAEVLEERLVKTEGSRDGFPPGGVLLELPVARYNDDIVRTVLVQENKLGSLMMAVYSFYSRPIKSLEAMSDVVEMLHDPYRAGVVEQFAAGGQPKWGDLIGYDATYDDSHPMIHPDRRAIVRAAEGYCDGAVWFSKFCEVGRHTLRLVCDS